MDESQKHIPELNIAILTFNAIEHTRMCLESIAANTRAPHNIFVLDNGSTDGTREWLSTIVQDNFHYRAAERNFGVPGGRNKLIETILPGLNDQSFIVFLDNDMEVMSGWDQTFFSFFAEHPEVGIASAFGHKMLVREHYRELLPAPLYTAPVDVACGGFACWVRAKVIKVIGGFDEKLGLFWHEDDDFSVSAVCAGYEVYALPHAAVVHHEHKSGAADSKIISGGSQENQAYLCNKWRSLGVVSEEGYIIRNSSGTLGSEMEKCQGDYRWIGQDAVIEVVRGDGDENKRDIELRLGCAKSEFYNRFPFEVEIITPKQTITRQFSSSNQVHSILVDREYLGTMQVHTNAFFIPGLYGMGAGWKEPVALRVYDSECFQVRYDLNSEKATAEVLWYSSVFDVFDSAAITASLIPALDRLYESLVIRPLSINESIVADSELSGTWRNLWEKHLLSAHFGNKCVIVGDPLLPKKLRLYEEVRKAQSSLRKLVGLIPRVPNVVDDHWLAAACVADELWVLSERERRMLLEVGVPNYNVKVLPYGLDTETFQPISSASQQELIEGSYSFIAKVDSLNDPFLRTCVAAYIQSFSASEPVRLVCTLGPMGGVIPHHLIQRLIESSDIKESDYQPIITISSHRSPATRAKLFQSSQCLLLSPNSHFPVYALEAMATGIPTLLCDQYFASCRQINSEEFAVDSNILDSLRAPAIRLEAQQKRCLDSAVLKAIGSAMRSAYLASAAAKQEGVGLAAEVHTRFSAARTCAWIKSNL